MLLAEFEIWHTRPRTPTRRVSLGAMVLPCEPAPGFGGLLLGAVIAAHLDHDDEDMFPDVHRLIDQIDAGHRIVQPRLRHRFQVDRHGMARSVHRIVGDGEDLSFEFESSGEPLQQVLGAVYAVERLAPAARHDVCSTMRRAMRWRGPIGPTMVKNLIGNGAQSFRSLADPRAWALDILGFAHGTTEWTKRDITRHFRDQVKDAHPDHGGALDRAAGRMDDLNEARRILMESRD